MRRATRGVAVALLLAGCASAPVQNVDPARHPNLAAAQRLCADAFQRISDAQDANEWDMSGHAKRAKELLIQASEEIKQAALTANRKGHS
jgi:hypothetical protein